LNPPEKKEINNMSTLPTPPALDRTGPRGRAAAAWGERLADVLAPRAGEVVTVEELAGILDTSESTVNRALKLLRSTERLETQYVGRGMHIIRCDGSPARPYSDHAARPLTFIAVGSGRMGIYIEHLAELLGKKVGQVVRYVDLIEEAGLSLPVGRRCLTVLSRSGRLETERVGYGHRIIRCSHLATSEQ
jgi:DNA-binding transcriptional ArsR family regulator